MGFGNRGDSPLAAAGPMALPGRLPGFEIPMQRILPRVLSVGLAALFAVALWFRVSSLETLPAIDGDEGWYGVQACLMRLGKPFTTTTPTGNPLNPFHAGVEALLLLVFRPAFW